MDEKLKQDMSRFSRLSYEEFRKLATDESLTPYERIGFPDSYRQGFEPAIVADILAKMPPLQARDGLLVDIGCGCTDVPRLLVEHCLERSHRLVLVDSQEMLDRVPGGAAVTKLAGKFPAPPASLDQYKGQASAVLAYSVLHYVFEGEDLFGFVDAACALLAPKGHLLLGDLPNVSKRRRFFASDSGIAFHKEFMKTTEAPVVEQYRLEPAKLDDGVLLGLLMRYRAAGFDAYLLPQGSELPMHNRREDLLIVRP